MEDGDHHYFMNQALKVAEAALDIGEVPVGCVVVLATERGPVIVSHGANQVNATRDATRHAEIVAIDRMLTGGLSSDRLRLPTQVYCRADHADLQPKGSSLLMPSHNTTDLEDQLHDKWTNTPDDPDHWTNEYGWGSGRLYTKSVLQKCSLYVTCEPCIMCAAALSEVGIFEVYYGCRNDKFGGCGSILCLHQDMSPNHKGYKIRGGILENEAINLLRNFYKRENMHAPEDKRKRKPPFDK